MKIQVRPLRLGGRLGTIGRQLVVRQQKTQPLLEKRGKRRQSEAQKRTDSIAMKWTDSELQQTLRNLRELLAVEVKRWIDPKTSEGAAIIAKACIALRNNNGGLLVVGFDNSTMKPDEAHRLADHRKNFHQDIIQAIVRKYASEAFEVDVDFVELDGSEFPVIVVPPGVKTPVASRAGLFAPDGKKLIIEHAVYVRSLDSNNTVSTTVAHWQDWESLVVKCMDNREADLARFLSRYAGLAGGKQLQGMMSTLAEKKSISSVPDPLDIMNKGLARFKAEGQKISPKLPDVGHWEVGLVIDGPSEVSHTANESFLNLITSNNPHLTGWPIWLVSNGFRDKTAWPYVFDGAWEAMIVQLIGDWSDHIDFWRISPLGQLYLIRALEDDIARGQYAPSPRKTLEFALVLWRVTETLAVGLRFARAMKFNEETSTLRFAFRWTELAGRNLSSWAHPERSLMGGRVAHQNEVIAQVTVPIGISDSILHQYVATVVAPLFSVFQGFELSQKVIEGIVDEVLNRGRR